MLIQLPQLPGTRCLVCTALAALAERPNACLLLNIKSSRYRIQIFVRKLPAGLKLHTKHQSSLHNTDLKSSKHCPNNNTQSFRVITPYLVKMAHYSIIYQHHNGYLTHLRLDAITIHGEEDIRIELRHRF